MDQVLEHVRTLHSGPWGRVLDAGTGQSSLEWVASLPGAEWTAVTAEPARAEALQRRFPDGRVLLGNWADPGLLVGEQFDTVIADYLLGAVDRFFPWGQLDVLRRLTTLAPRLYLVGLEPYPDEGGLVTEIADLRESVHYWLGRRPHREVPEAWVVARLEEMGWTVQVTRFANHYGPEFIEGELRALEVLLKDDRPADFLKRIAHLRAKGRRQLRQGPLECSHDYLVAATRGTPRG